jgi:hypothetical protein
MFWILKYQWPLLLYNSTYFVCNCSPLYSFEDSLVQYLLLMSEVNICRLYSKVVRVRTELYVD